MPTASFLRLIFSEEACDQIPPFARIEGSPCEATAVRNFDNELWFTDTFFAYYFGDIIGALAQEFVEETVIVNEYPWA